MKLAVGGHVVILPFAEMKKEARKDEGGRIQTKHENWRRCKDEIRKETGTKGMGRCRHNLQ